MATATPRTEKRFVETEIPRGVLLDLNEDETRTLWAILMRVGGSPFNSPRMHASEMLEALAEATGRSPYGGPDDYTPESGLYAKGHSDSVYFRDYLDTQ